MQFHTFLHIARNSGLVQCDLLPASAPSVRSTQPSHHACFCSQWYLLQGHQSGAKQPEVTNRPMSRVRKQWYQRLAKNFAFSFRILNYWNLALVWERELPSSSETFLKYVHTNTVPCALLSFPQLSPSPDLIAQSTHSFQAFSTPSELTYSFHPWGRSWGHLHVRVGS